MVIGAQLLLGAQPVFFGRAALIAARFPIGVCQLGDIIKRRSRRPRLLPRTMEQWHCRALSVTAEFRAYVLPYLWRAPERRRKTLRAQN